jgi:mono/diheme cytochrome c family protein
MRWFFVIYGLMTILAVTVFGLRGCTSTRPPLEVFPDMDRQNKLLPQASSAFFADGRADRPPVPGTIPHVTGMQEQYPHLAPDNRLRGDAYLASGRTPDGDFGDGIPVPVTYAAISHGRDLYTIYCTVCHGATGDGGGVLANERYQFNTIISLLQPRIVQQPDGEIFETITRGKNTMGAYGAKIRVEDRWKIVLYLRALQRAGNASVGDVPPEHLGDLGL